MPCISGIVKHQRHETVARNTCCYMIIMVSAQFSSPFIKCVLHSKCIFWKIVWWSLSFSLSLSLSPCMSGFFLSKRVNNILCNDLLNGVRSKMSTNIQLHSGFDTLFISRDGLRVECVDVTKSHYWCWCLLLVLLLLSLLLLQLLLLYLLLLFIQSECMFLEMASFYCFVSIFIFLWR